jgi:prephenate dehydratase
MPSFTSVFESVGNGETDYGIIPLENSLTGSIHENFDLLQKYELKIVGEITLRIIHNLLAKPGTRLDEINRVYSHPEIFEQCSHFLNQHEWELVAAGDTAEASERVSLSGNPGDAAIANLVAGEKYGLVLVQEGIETDPRNYTRFVIISGESILDHEIKKTSLILSAKNEPGALFSILKIFADNKINMTKLESRPIQGEPWSYMFYIDMEGDIESLSLGAFYKSLKEKTAYLKILGRY